MIKNSNVNDNIENSENFQTILKEEELEQFLCFLGLRDDLFNIFLSRGLNSIEKLTKVDQFNISKNALTENKKELIINNINLVFDKINSYYIYNNVEEEEEEKVEELKESKEFKNSEEKLSSFNEENKTTLKKNKPSFLSIIKETLYDFGGIPLTKEILMSSFKLKNKSNLYLPKDFKKENFTADKLYASFLQDKKIAYIENLEGFKNLRHLYLNNNKLQYIDNMNFPNLNILELSNNFIRKITNLEKLTDLQNLNLEKNLIQKLENLRENINLDNLNLNKQMLTRHQNFEILPETLNQDNNLQVLLLEGCNISDPSNLKIFSKLSRLKLNNNRIYDLGLLIEGLKYMKDTLEYLTLSKNPFTDSNKSFRDVIVIRCPNLVELDNKTITTNEKQFVNSLYMRKFGRSNTSQSRRNKSINGISGKLVSLNVNVGKLNIEDEKKKLIHHPKTVTKNFLNMYKK